MPYINKGSTYCISVTKAPETPVLCLYTHAGPHVLRVPYRQFYLPEVLIGLLGETVTRHLGSAFGPTNLSQLCRVLARSIELVPRSRPLIKALTTRPCASS